MATLSTAAKNAALDAIVLLGETGTTNPGIMLYITGPSNETVVFAAFPSPAFGAAAVGRAELLAPAELIYSTSFTPTLWNLVTRENTFLIINATLGGAGSGADMEWNPSVLTGVFAQKLRVDSLFLEIA
jgi:hypothetical protein